MGKQNIWNRLIDAGLSEAGTAGLMGNFMAESLLKSNNVENRCPISDEAYTDGVNNGTIKFVDTSTAYGYGLAQWTAASRKRNLLNRSKELGVSIDDENMQVDFAVWELENEYASLLSFLKRTEDIYTSASRVCTEYERPAVNNISTRYNYAMMFYNELSGSHVASTAAESATLSNTVNVCMPVLKFGSSGIPVGWCQLSLARRGYNVGKYGPNKDGVDCSFGNTMLSALKQFQKDNGIKQTGIVDEQTWTLLVK